MIDPLWQNHAPQKGCWWKGLLLGQGWETLVKLVACLRPEHWARYKKSPLLNTLLCILWFFTVMFPRTVLPVSLSITSFISAILQKENDRVLFSEVRWSLRRQLEFNLALFKYWKNTSDCLFSYSQANANQNCYLINLLKHFMQICLEWLNW